MSWRGAVVCVVVLTAVVVVGCQDGYRGLPWTTHGEPAISPAAQEDSALAQAASSSPLFVSPLTENRPGSPMVVAPYQPRSVPSPQPGKAALTGRVLAKVGDSNQYEAVVLAAVYLAPVIYGEDGTPIMAGLDSTGDPNTSTDMAGYFTFENVPAGEYAFVVFHDMTHILIRDQEENQIIIMLEPGSVIDLGDMLTQLP